MKRFLTYILLASAAIACHIEMPQKPVAKFKFTPENGCQAPCNVTFTSESENAASVQWDFNDGSPLQTGNPLTHQFTAGKIYEVKLIVKGVDGGSSGETRSVKIDAAAASTPEADFKYTITNDSIAPAAVTFDNQSENAIRYEWDFGDTGSSSDTDTVTNPSHNYTNPGTYKVKLVAYNGQNVSSTKEITIVVKQAVASVDAISISGGYNFPTDIASDANGNIYICGTAKGTIQLGNGKTFSSTSNDFFVAKFNSAGLCQWVYTDGSTGNDHANGLTLDANNHVYVTGFIAGPLASGGTSTKGDTDGFVAKIDGSSGEPKWFKTFGGALSDQGRSLAFFETGGVSRIYLAGTVEGNNVDFNGILKNANERDVCFVLLDTSTGDFGLPTIIGGPGAQIPEAVGVDTEGNGYIVGGFEQTITFPSLTQLTSAGKSDAFLAKWVRASNQFQWAKRTGSGEDDFAYDVVIDATKNVYVTGMHKGNLPELLISAGSDENVFLGKWNANGDVQIGKDGFNNGSIDLHGGIAKTSTGNLIIAGSFSNTGRFPMGNGSFKNSLGVTDILITEVESNELNAAGRLYERDGGTHEDRVAKICVTASGYVYATGWFKEATTFGNVPLNGNSSMENTFIVRYKL